MNNTLLYGRIYGRFSSKPQERGDSKRRQIEGAASYAKRNAIQILDQPYFDEAVSGKDGANLEKEFGRLLKEAKSGELILVEALDRLGRQNPFILCNLVYQLVNRGVSVHAWQEGKVITPKNIDELDTQFSLFTGAAIGHQDNRRKMKRLQDTTKAAYELAEKGVQTGTLRKYLPECFKWDEEKRELGLHDEKAEVIRQIFQWYAEGLGRTRIAQMLNEKQTPTVYNRSAKQPDGTPKPWLETSIKKILQNESYAGVLHVKGNAFTCIPKVVSRELFDQVQLMLKRNTKRMGNMTGRKNNLFASLAICKHCGGTVNVNVTPPKKEGNKATYSYRCKNARLKVCPKPHKMLNAKYLEVAFFLHYFGGSPESVFGSKNAEIKSKIESVKSRIATIEKAMGNLYDMAENGDVEAKKRIAKRNAEKTDLENELVLLNGSLAEDSHLPAMLDEIAAIMPVDELFSKAQAIEESKAKLQAKLEDNENRNKLVNILPSIFEKVTIDCTNGTFQAIRKGGEPLKEVVINPIYQLKL